MPAQDRLFEEKGSLARLLEESSELRRRVLEKPEQVLTRWVNDRAIGVASVNAMKLNHLALETVAKWWVERCPYPKTVPVERMRDEVSRHRCCKIWLVFFD